MNPEENEQFLKGSEAFKPVQDNSLAQAYRLQAFAEAFAFVGNSLLVPISHTSQAGLHPAFWEHFPDFESFQVREALEALKAWAECAPQDSVTKVSVEFTQLFVGPPKPTAPPWETYYRGEEVTSGFGRPTLEMREALKEAGLELFNENNQYEDHIGIELLLLSELCSSAVKSSGVASSEPYETSIEGETASRKSVDAQANNEDIIEWGIFEKAQALAQDHPASWIDKLLDKVKAAYPDGYFVCILTLAKALLVAFES